MARQWGKVARWAGIGNNGSDGSLRSDDGMVEDTMVQGTEEKELARESAPETTGGSQAAGAGGEGSADPVAPAGLLTTELEQIRGERDQLLDRLARLQAEVENSRRREGKERGDLRGYAGQRGRGAVEPFRGVMDNFQLALKSGGTAAQLRTGVELILKQMEEALRGLNVQPVETGGTQGEPRRTEAVGSR